MAKKLKGYYDVFTGVPARGFCPADIMVIGLTPPAKSTSKIQPMSAKFLSEFERLALETGNGGLLKSVYYSNIEKARREPGTQKKKMSKAEFRSWKVYIDQEIRLVKPRRILVVGTELAKEYCPGFDSLREDHGTYFINPALDNALVVPTFSFGMTFYDPDVKSFWVNDVRRFFKYKPFALSEYRLVRDFISLENIPVGSDVVIDLETTGLEMTSQITMLGLKVVTIPESLIVEYPSKSAIAELGRLIEERQLRVIMHNSVFDLSFFYRYTFGHWPQHQTGDSMLLAHTVGQPVLSLKHLTTQFTSRPGSRSGGGTTDPFYLAEDLASTEEVYQKFAHAESRFISGVLNEVVHVVALMKARGVYLDTDILSTLGTYFLGQIEHYRSLLDCGEINLNSSAQLAQFLLDKGFKLSEKTAGGKFAVGEQVLLRIEPENDEQRELIKNLLKYKEMAKAHSGFIVSYQEMIALDPSRHYIFPSLKLAGTRTGRLSCSNPNLQQVTRTGPLKTMFVSRWPGGNYGLVDLSQAELRVAALVSGDELLLASLLSDDPHRTNAAGLYGIPEAEVSAIQRKKSKLVMFGVLYGGGAKGLSQRTGFDVDSITEVIDRMKSRFPKLMKWIEKTQEDGFRNLSVTTLYGRTRSLVKENADEGERGVYRKAVNTPIQSLASDMNLVILCGIFRRLKARGLKSRPLFLVHDSILLEIYPGEERECARCVQQAYTDLWNTPLAKLPGFKNLPIVGELQIGPSWAAVESTNEDYAPVWQAPCSSHEDMTEFSKCEQKNT